MDHGLPVELDTGDGHIGPESLPRGDHADPGQLSERIRAGPGKNAENADTQSSYRL